MISRRWPTSPSSLIGEGEATVDGAGPGPGGTEALERAGLAALELGAKEGLALLNGTQLMAGIGALAHHDACGWR